ncbi:MAG: isocitrate lyase/phosphoenolpyruvate mutase family protein [Microbacterium arborescens]
MTDARSSHAARFRSLHHAPHRPLLLANAWDVASARLIAATGAAAIATTSAGLAWAHGVGDGEGLTRDQVVGAVSRIAASVDLPVTVDIEGGYGADADAVEQTVFAVVAAGAVGVNIEDGARSVDETVARIRAARRGAERAGVPVFINARTDVFLTDAVPGERRLDEAVARAGHYLAAGADGVFIPGVADAAIIGSLVEAIAGPVNVMAGPGSPAVAELAALGVARISLGSAVAQAAYAVARRAAHELMTAGTYSALAGGVDYGELNELSVPR